MPTGTRAGWTTYPWITFSAGHENSRLPDRDLDRYALPGGGLLGLTPGIQLRRRLGERVRLELSGQLGYERFDNSEDRAVLGAVADADVRVQLASSWYWRSSVAVNRYSDSAYETANRIGGGIETQLGVSTGRWSLELIGEAEARRYYDLVAPDASGELATYTESGPSLGIGCSGRTLADGLVSARVVWQRNEARDPLYDADSWEVQSSARTGIGFGSFLTLYGLAQLRSFASRPAPADDDSYWQVGLGVDRAITPVIRLTARYAFARVTDPSDDSEDLHRVAVAATWSLGKLLGLASEPDLTLPGDLAVAPLRAHEARLFRCHGPAARVVSLVGDFNGWDPTANILTPGRDGWWETQIRLEAGSHEYAYVVDGRTVPPNDAEVLVDDGFGGKNGLIWVQPEGE